MADRDDLEDRVPCSDEMCVGIIGASGRCGVCGKPGAPPAPGWTAPPHDDLHSSPEPEAQAGPGPDRVPETVSASAADESDPSDRVPCHDEMCVGILSPEGRCGTCGRQWPTE